MCKLLAVLFIFPILSLAAPFDVDPKLFQFEAPQTLGLQRAAGTENILVYRAQANESQYNHGAVVFGFKGKLYAQWQSSIKDEDAPETRILYAVSENGLDWSTPEILVNARANAKISNGGWWSNGESLIAYINVWPNGLEPRGGLTEYIKSLDGQSWSKAKPILFANGKPVNGVIEQDLQRMPSGQILTALHQQPGLIAKPFWTNDPSGISGWHIGNIENVMEKPIMSRELEPSHFYRRDGAWVMTFRDQSSSFKIWASLSVDKGRNWTKAVATDMPDSRAKQSAGNLPDGSAYIVNNPSGSKAREPLVLSVSSDTLKFDRAFLLREGGSKLSDPRYDGLYKRRGFSYPKSVIWKGYLYAAYAQNKEEIMLTRVPLSSLIKKS